VEVGKGSSPVEEGRYILVRGWGGDGLSEWGEGGNERGGVGEGEKPKVEGRTEEEMIRARILVEGGGPRIEDADRGKSYNDHI
jgi:hypothetical protein